MNFDKFKSITPDPSVKADLENQLTDSDKQYLASLDTLPTFKKQNKALKIIAETAAAVAIVLAVALWAIIGRGFRLTSEAPSHGTALEYQVIYSEPDNLLLEGGDRLQRFFDDFASGKPCTLHLFIAKSKSQDGGYEGYTETYEINKDGNGFFSTDESGFNITTPLKQLRFAFSTLKDTCYLQCDFYGVEDNILELPSAFLKNTHENSDRVFDLKNTETIVTEDNRILQGEKDFCRFFEYYYKKQAVEMKINDTIYLYDGQYIYTGTEDKIENSKYKNVGYRTSNEYKNSTDIYLNIYHETEITDSNVNVLPHYAAPTAFITLENFDLERLGIRFFAETLTVTDGSSSRSFHHTDPLVKQLFDTVKISSHGSILYDITNEPTYLIDMTEDMQMYVYTDQNGKVEDYCAIAYSKTSQMRIPYGFTDKSVYDILQNLIDNLPKSVIITPDIRAQFYSLSYEYRFEYLPYFDNPEYLTLEDLINYTYAMNGFPDKLPREGFTYITESMFGISFDIPEKFYLPMSAEGVPSYEDRVKRLVSLEVLPLQDGRTKVIAEFENYLAAGEEIATQVIYDKLEGESLSTYQKITYIAKEGYIPEKILSNSHASVDENGAIVYYQNTFSREYAKRWEMLRNAIDKFVKDEGKIDEYQLRNQKFYQTPDENGYFSFKFYGECKPYPEYADEFFRTDEEGWTAIWETLYFKEDKNGITCLGYDDPYSRIDTQEYE